MSTASPDTFLEIYNRILQRLNISSSDMGKYSMADIVRQYNYAQRNVAMLLMKKSKDFLITNEVAGIVRAQETYSIGNGGDFNITNWLGVKQILAVSSDGGEVPLDPIDISERHEWVGPGTDCPTEKYLKKYYISTKAIGDIKAPCIGVLPVPAFSLTDGLRLIYVFKPRPMCVDGGNLTNGDEAPDIPEAAVGYTETYAVSRLFKDKGAEDALRMEVGQGASEERETEDTVKDQPNSDPVLMTYYDKEWGMV